MILNTIKTKPNFLNFNHPQTYLFLSLSLILLSILVIFVNNEFLNISEIDIFATILLSISSIIFIFSSILLKFSKENIKVIKTGTLKITQNEFIINKSTLIPFHIISDLKLITNEFEGKYKYYNTDFESSYSLGIENFIVIQAKKKEIKKQIQINSKRELGLLHDFISNQIVNHKFKKVDFRKLIAIFRDDFRKTTHARAYIASYIKKRKITSIEGLLMMNYNSDTEAKELRKKYQL